MDRYGDKDGWSICPPRPTVILDWQAVGSPDRKENYNTAGEATGDAVH